MLKNKQLLLFLALSYTIILIYFTLGNPDEVIPQTGIKFQDKIFHFIAYVALAILWCYFSVISKIKKGILKVFAVSLLFGVLLEVIQEPLNPLRTFDIIDLIANCLGVIFGTIIVAYYFQRMKLKS